MNFLSINMLSSTITVVFLFFILFNNHNSFSVEQNSISSNVNASDVYYKELLVVPKEVTNFIILIPNESHESMKEKHKLISDHNSYFLPKNLVINEGTSISFINADAPWDTPHPHTIFIKKDNKEDVFTSSKLNYGDFTQPISLEVGKYSIGDEIYNFMKGNLTVLNNDSSIYRNSSPDNNENTLIMGGFYSPTSPVDNKADNSGGIHPGDSLQYYIVEFNKKGLKILDTFDFSYAECTYCKDKYWPDNKTGNHTLILYSSEKPYDLLINDLQKLVKDNVYI